MDQRGQAFSTFKLLIAAIVAMAILAILIPIIMNVIGIIKASPLNETKTLLSDLVSQPGALRLTKEVSFDPSFSLAASALTENMQISKDQICMSTGQFEEDSDNGFECSGCGDASDNQRLIYHGKTNRAAKIAIVCNVNVGELLLDIDAYDLDDDPSIVGNSITDACQVCEDKGKCCAIVLKRS